MYGFIEVIGKRALELSALGAVDITEEREQTKRGALAVLGNRTLELLSVAVVLKIWPGLSAELESGR